MCGIAERQFFGGFEAAWQTLGEFLLAEDDVVCIITFEHLLRLAGQADRHYGIHIFRKQPLGIAPKYIFGEYEGVLPSRDLEESAVFVDELLNRYCGSAVSGLGKQGKAFQMFIEPHIGEPFSAKDSEILLFYAGEESLLLFFRAGFPGYEVNSCCVKLRFEFLSPEG